MSNFPTGVFLGERRRRRRPVATTLRVVAVVVLVVLALGVASVGWNWVHANRALDGVGIAGLGDGPSTEAPEGTRNTLLVTNDASGVELVTVVQRSPGRDGVEVLFLPLTLEVLPPGEATLTTIEQIRDDDGIEQLVATVEDYTGIPLHHVVDVDLVAAAEAVEAVGDVRVCIPRTDEEVGEVVKVSDECPAVDAVMISDAIALDDDEGVGLFDRFEIRRAIAVAFAQRLDTSTFLLHPLRARRTADALGTALFTDVDLGVTDLFDLAAGFDDESTAAADLRVVPGFTTGDTGRVEPYPDQAEALFQAFRDVTELPTEIGTSPPSDLEPGDVRVLVLNGVGEPGLAGSMAAFLKSRGFEVPEPGNVTEFNPAQRDVIVRHTPATRPQAGLVADFLPDARLEEVDRLDDDVPVVVVVGSDWNG